MIIGNEYELVLYNGNTSKRVEGMLIASLRYDQLRLYQKNANQMSLVHHPLLPTGTPLEYKEGIWYVMETPSGNQEFVYSTWIKDNGITLKGSKSMVLSGSFKSGRDLESINKAFINEGIFDISIALVAGSETSEVDTPDLGVQYIISLNDSAQSTRWGTYLATVDYTLLPSLGLSGEMEYRNYTWEDNHLPNLTGYRWMVFTSFLDPDVKFAVPQELLKSKLNTSSNQGVYQFTKVGTLDDVAHVRSVLNIQSCTDIVIGTNS